MSAYDTRATGGMPVGGTTVLGDGHHIHKRIAWGALFGGVIIAVAVQVLLSLLGAGIGLGTVNTNAGSTPSGSSIGIGASHDLPSVLGGRQHRWRRLLRARQRDIRRR